MVCFYSGSGFPHFTLLVMFLCKCVLSHLVHLWMFFFFQLDDTFSGMRTVSFTSITISHWSQNTCVHMGGAGSGGQGEKQGWAGLSRKHTVLVSSTCPSQLIGFDSEQLLCRCPQIVLLRIVRIAGLKGWSLEGLWHKRKGLNSKPFEEKCRTPWRRLRLSFLCCVPLTEVKSCGG